MRPFPRGLPAKEESCAIVMHWQMNNRKAGQRVGIA